VLVAGARRVVCGYYKSDWQTKSDLAEGESRRGGDRIVVGNGVVGKSGGADVDETAATTTARSDWTDGDSDPLRLGGDLRLPIVEEVDGDDTERTRRRPCVPMGVGVIIIVIALWSSSFSPAPEPRRRPAVHRWLLRRGDMVGVRLMGDNGNEQTRWIV
jgi:hypothetical protein